MGAYVGVSILILYAHIIHFSQCWQHRTCAWSSFIHLWTPLRMHLRLWYELVNGATKRQLNGTRAPTFSFSKMFSWLEEVKRMDDKKEMFLKDIKQMLLMNPHAKFPYSCNERRRCCRRCLYECFGPTRLHHLKMFAMPPRRSVSIMSALSSGILRRCSLRYDYVETRLQFKIF